jgi:hypothetical protein
MKELEPGIYLIQYDDGEYSAAKVSNKYTKYPVQFIGSDEIYEWDEVSNIKVVRKVDTP